MRKLRIMTILVILIGGMFVALSATTSVSGARMTPEQFFDELTAEDRLHIRTAMDYAIPRQQIIDSVLLGQGALLASPIEANAIGYDSAIQPREFSIEKALDEMEAAFGYRYNDSAVADEDRKGYFSMVIMAPTSRDDRMQWAALITKCFQEIGIDVTLKYANWNVAVSVFSPREEVAGFDYEHGGYDAFFIGWTGSPSSDVSQWFGSDNFAPSGSNIAYIDDPVVDAIIETSLTNTDKALRLAALTDFQEYFVDEIPYFVVLQLMDLWAIDPDLKGVSLSFDYPNFGNWSYAITDPITTAVTVQTPGDLKDCNPLMASSYYDWLMGGVNGGTYGSLFTSYPDAPEVYYGDIAENWTVSDDGLVWTFDIHDGILFSDNTPLTVDDVIFTYKQWINPAVVAWGGTSQAVWMNASNIVKIDDDTVEFTLNDFYAYGESLFTQSILSETQMSLVADAAWKTDATTTTFPPLGTGPYMPDPASGMWDVASSETHLILNPYYDNTIRTDDGWFNNLNRIPSIYTKLVTSAATCVAGLSTGEINIIDSNVAIQPFLGQLTNVSWARLEKELGWGHQAFYINQRSPIWGMEAMDPRVQYPGDYADSAPFDFASIFFGILCLTTFQIVRKRKK